MSEAVSGNLSRAQLFALQSATEQERLRAAMGAEVEALLRYDWRGWWARPNQLPPEPNGWRFWLVMAGRGFGKTRIGGEWVREQVRSFPYVNLIGATADDARDIMIEGESGILAICPPYERPEYVSTKRKLVWPNGAVSLIFTADEPERLRGKQHMKVWADEVATWRYEESWDQMIFGLRLGGNPQAVVTTTPKPIGILKMLTRDLHCVVTRGSSHENADNLAPEFFSDLIRKYEGTRLGRQEIYAELLEDEGLAYRFSELVHVVEEFPVPEHWERFEFMDYGSSNPTAWYAAATDEEGNYLVFDEIYRPGLPSDLAREVWSRRRSGWWRRERGEYVSAPCYADPSIRSRLPTSHTALSGRELSIETEFADHGVYLIPGQNDRRAGFLRVAEAITPDAFRSRPEWAGPGDGRAPQLYIVGARCPNLVQQLGDAPLEGPDGRYPGECVDAKWETALGHAHAALRYGLMSRPSRSEGVARLAQDPQVAFLERLWNIDDPDWNRADDAEPSFFLAG